jgi:hypothetical protein
MHRNSVRFTLHIALILVSGLISGLLGDVFSWWNFFFAFAFGLLMGFTFGRVIEWLHDDAVKQRKLEVAAAKALHPAGSALIKKD